MTTTPRRLAVGGTVHVPGDKSLSHRALILSALADGTSAVRGVLQSADTTSTAGVLRALGVRVPELGPDLRIEGSGLRGLRQPTGDLDCGNSGTTTRLMAGVAAASALSARFTGDESLSRRPMRRVARPLEAMGARIELENGDGLPMTVHGARLSSVDWVSESASAQVKSAVLLAGLVAGVPVSVREPARSRDHTERLLQALGATVSVDGLRVHMEPPAAIPPLDYTVPGDPSSAAFFAALAALADDGAIEMPGVCINATRVGFLDLLAAMGARVEYADARDAAGEPVATVRVHAATLRGTSVGGADIPAIIDELPLVACLAARADGETVVTGAEELRHKESDRIAAVVANLRALGADARELPDGFAVRGGDRPFRGRVRTHGDHRIAMAFGILGALPGSDVELDDPACVAVSFPDFWDALRRAGGR